LALIATSSSARADTWEARSELSNFSMKIGAPGADICVVFPESLRNAKCEGVNFATFRQVSSDHSVAVVIGDTYWISVGVGGVSSPPQELTNAEARELRQQALRKSAPNAVIGPLTALRVHGLQVFTVRSELGPNVVDVYWVVGRGGITEVAFSRPRDVETVAAPIIAAMVETFDARPAASVNARIGSALLALFAPTPLVVLAAALASRKKKSDE
jgi:hypothetical protein